jgi:putative phosphoesterase
MKIALFSDIHANLPAFNAMLTDLDQQAPDAIYCLGDLIGYNVHPNQIIAEIRNRKIATIAGNHDLKINGLSPLTNDELAISGKNFAYHIVHEDNRNYLSSLPAHISLTYQLNAEQLNILLVHGSPRSVNEYVLADTDEAYVLELMHEANAHILCVGHSHMPYHRMITKADGSIAHIVNAGSVGKPKDGNPMGCYVILTIGTDSIGVEFRRFEYDVEMAATAIENSPLPNEFADALRLAR